MPISAWTDTNLSNMCLPTVASTALIGSSNRIISGLEYMARARPSRAF